MSDHTQLEGPSTFRVAMVTLGCSKNFVDSEQMGVLLREAGYALTDDPGDADAIVINTCAFIDAAKEEAIDTILDMAEYKADPDSPCRFILVTGCLGERYGDEIPASLPEVDAILGTRSYYAIAEALDRLRRGETSEDVPVYRSTCPEDAIRHLSAPHEHTTGRYAYLKIAEGCSRRCAYCAIPGIRGPLISRPIEDLVDEAAALTKRGAEELILIAQDTTSYGMDRYGEPKLAELLRRLSRVEGVRRLRVLYMYADRFTDELLEVFRTDPHVLPYVDLPIQHASDRVLRRMARPDRQASLERLFGRLRQALPQVVIRTTVMVGFPGETDEDYEILKQFVREQRFDHLGCFVFSPEEGTPAANYPDPVPPDVAEARYRGIMELQQAISREKMAQRIGEVYEVTIEGVTEDRMAWRGRTWFQAPDADTETIVYAENPDVDWGQSVEAEIVDAGPYELIAIARDREVSP